MGCCYCVWYAIRNVVLIIRELSDEEKMKQKIRNPVSRASFVINTVSRYEFCLNPAPADDLNPAVPQNFCAFPVIPLCFLG